MFTGLVKGQVVTRCVCGGSQWLFKRLMAVIKKEMELRACLHRQKGRNGKK